MYYLEHSKRWFCPHEYAAQFKCMRLKVTVKFNTKYFFTGAKSEVSLTHYHNYDQLTTELKSLNKDYPQMTR